MANANGGDVGNAGDGTVGAPGNDGTDRIGIAGNDAGITGGIGADDSATGTGSGAESNERIAGLNVADPGTDAGRYGFKADGTPRGKPGRKPGNSPGPSPGRKSTGNAKAANSQGVNGGVEKLLLSLHTMAAIKLKTPEMAIDQQEARMLASAITAVQDHYNFTVSEETTLWTNLIVALGSVYGPRVMVIMSRREREKTSKAKPAATVTSIRPDPTKPDTNTSGVFNIPGMHDPRVT